ncbi:AAA family ATPase [Siccirubricoccus sp. G192]|nr:AAA family ATPase [Siccirubricoccus sp. G192]
MTVASTKGGAGKTTIVMALAGTLAAEGLRVAVVDADPNRAYALLGRAGLRGPRRRRAAPRPTRHGSRRRSTSSHPRPTWCSWTRPASATAQPSSP